MIIYFTVRSRGNPYLAASRKYAVRPALDNNNLLYSLSDAPISWVAFYLQNELFPYFAQLPNRFIEEYDLMIWSRSSGIVIYFVLDNFIGNQMSKYCGLIIFKACVPKNITAS